VILGGGGFANKDINVSVGTIQKSDPAGGEIRGQRYVLKQTRCDDLNRGQGTQYESNKSVFHTKIRGRWGRPRT